MGSLQGFYSDNIRPGRFFNFLLYRTGRKKNDASGKNKDEMPGITISYTRDKNPGQESIIHYL
jgi:hypothetical protein